MFESAQKLNTPIENATFMFEVPGKKGLEQSHNLTKIASVLDD